MIKKIEAWLRQIINEEVEYCLNDFNKVAERVKADINGVEAKFTADLKKFEGTFEQSLVDIETRITERLEVLVTRTVERLETKFQHVEHTISSTVDDHWKIDEVQRKADEALRNPAPKRR